MPDLRLKVVHKPSENNRILVMSTSKNTSVLIKGKEDCNLLCGRCEAVLAEGVGKGQFYGPIFICNQCDAYNETIETG